MNKVTQIILGILSVIVIGPFFISILILFLILISYYGARFGRGIADLLSGLLEILQKND